MQQETAQSLAQDALIWLASDEDLLGVFLNASGFDPAMVRESADSPDFLRAVLEFLLMDDRWILGFSEATQTPPERVLEARRALPGGAEVHWT